MAEPAEAIPEMIWLAALSLIACCLQFYLGARIGRRCGDRIAGAQGLGQKNTVLAIWMALTYLQPHIVGGSGGIRGLAQHHQFGTALPEDQKRRPAKTKRLTEC